jgi:hypothetical protein
MVAPIGRPLNLGAFPTGTPQQIEAIKRIDKSPMHSLGKKKPIFVHPDFVAKSTLLAVFHAQQIACRNVTSVGSRKNLDGENPNPQREPCYFFLDRHSIYRVGFMSNWMATARTFRRIKCPGKKYRR